MASTWILSIARFKDLSAFRRRRDAQLDEASTEMVADTPEQTALNIDRNAQLRSCIARMSREHREGIEFVYSPTEHDGLLIHFFSTPFYFDVFPYRLEKVRKPGRQGRRHGRTYFCGARGRFWPHRCTYRGAQECPELAANRTHVLEGGGDEAAKQDCLTRLFSKSRDGH